jgi:peptide/nickel transport system substrate-binding protein
MEILKTNVERINPKFKIEIRTLPGAQVVREANQSKLAMAFVNWTGDYADPDNFIRAIYHSKGSFGKRHNMNDARIDQLVDQAYSTTDRAKRAALYGLVGRRAAEAVPFIVMPSSLGYVVLREEVKGYEENNNPLLFGGVLLKNLSK